MHSSARIPSRASGQPCNPPACAFADQASGEQRCDQRDGAGIQEQQETGCPFADRSSDRQARLHSSFELRQALVDQVESDMGFSIEAPFVGCTFAGQLDGLARHRHLRIEGCSCAIFSTA